MSLANLNTEKEKVDALRMAVGAINKLRREYGDELIDRAIEEFQTAREVAFVQAMSDRSLNEVHSSLSLLERLSGRKRDLVQIVIGLDTDT